MWVLSSPVVMMGMYYTWWMGPLKVMMVNWSLACIISKNIMEYLNVRLNRGSVVVWKSVVAFLALVKNCAALVHWPSLHHVIFQLRVVAFRTPLLYYHLRLPPLLPGFPSLVFPNPLLVSFHLKFGLHDFALMQSEVPANSWKVRLLWQSWHSMVSLMLSRSMRAPQTGQKSVWN